jgi:methyl-accepting chemotaxis protein
MSGDEPPEGEEANVIVRLLGTVTPDPIRRSFAIKFGLVLLVMAVSIGVIGWAATETIAAETEQSVESQYSSVALQESDIIEEWLDRNRLSATLVSDSPNWDKTDPTDLSRDLETEEAGLSADVENMHLIDTGDGTPVIAGSTSTTISAGTTLAETERDWVSERVSNLSDLSVDGVFVKDTYAVGSQRLVGFVSPVSVKQDRYLLIEVSVFDVTSSLQGQERAERGFTQVVNGDNTVVIDESGADLLSTYAEDEQAREPIRLANELRSEPGTEQLGVITSLESGAVLNETYTVGFSPVEDSDWVVLTHAPRSSVFGFVQTIQNFGLAATIVAVLLIGIVGTMLGYSTSASIDRLTAKTEQMQEGDLDVTFYTPRIDNIGRLYAGFADMRDALNEQINEAERSRKEAEVARAEAEEMATYLQEKAEEYSQIMQECAAGDLTQRMSKDGEEESMDRIADEFNEMIEELEKTTGQLKSYVDEVEEAGAEVEQSASTVREASEQVADSIQRISDGASDQQERLQEISETMDDVAARLEDFAAQHPDIDFGEPLDQIRSVAQNIEETAEVSASTMSEAENVAGAAEEQAAELNEVGERAHDLQRYAQPLRDILNRFETEAEHEFVFSVGPTGGSATPSVATAGDEDTEEDASEDAESDEGDD